MTVLGIQTFLAKTIRYLSRNEGVLCPILVVVKGKALAVKDLKKTEIHKTFWKIKVYGCNYSQPKGDIKPYTKENLDF